METTRPMTFGEKLVGLTFNPSGDAKVQRAKELCAELADLLQENREDRFEKINNGSMMASSLYSTLYDHAIGEILNAQMNVVKVLTLKS